MEISRTPLPGYPAAVSGKGQQRPGEAFKQGVEEERESTTAALQASLPPPAERVYQGEYIDRKSRLDYREIIREPTSAPHTTADAPPPSHYQTNRAVATYQGLSSEAARLDDVELLPRIDNFV